MMGKAQQTICHICCFLKKPCSKLTGRPGNPVLFSLISSEQLPKATAQEFLCCSLSLGNSLKSLKAVLAG